MPYTTYNCDTMTGGAARGLDALAVGDITTGDRAVVMMTAKSYFFKYNSTGTAAEQVATYPRVVRPDDYSTGGNWEEYQPETSGTSVLVQAQHAVVTAAVSGTTIMPIDDTIPQNTEGFEVITCAITPSSASNLLIILANVCVSYYDPVGSYLSAMALFQDTTASALAAVLTNASGTSVPTTLVHKMTAGTTSETTFKIRVGPGGAGTVYINTANGVTTRRFGGVHSTTLTILEYTP